MSVDVSVVFLQFNPIYEKIIASLYSLIIQRDVSFEIIISDDGSKEDYFGNDLRYYMMQNELLSQFNKDLNI